VKRSVLSLLALLLAGVLLAACGGDGNDESSRSSGSSSGGSSESSEAEFNDADVTFVQGMIPHHEQAVEMAELASTQAEGDDVKDLAARIEEAQGPEIATMEGWLEEWDVERSGGEMGGMDDGDEGDVEMGGGRMSEDEMSALEEAEGAEFDEMFLTMMVEHHEGAVEMAETEIDEGQNTDAIALARDIIEAQEAEIEEMNGLLEASAS
jgi:uncharacterized protein (DUF305 family)